MRTHLDVADSAVAPGDTSIVALRLANDAPHDVSCRLRVVGIEAEHVEAPDVVTVAGGAAADVEIAITPPKGYAAGRHALAVELDMGRAGPPTLIDFEMEIEASTGIVVQVNPTTIRGRRRGRFDVVMQNRGDRAVQVDLSGSGEGLSFRFRPERVTLRRGERTRTKARVTGPRPLIGDSKRRLFTVKAQGHGSPVYARGGFQQRPIVAGGARRLIAVFAVFAIWAAGLATVLTLIDRSEENDAAAVGELAFSGTADGDGVADGGGDSGGDDGGDGGETPGADEEPGGPEVPTVEVSGSAKAGTTGDDGGISVALRPVLLDAPEPGASGTPARSATRAKSWPGRRLLQPGNVGETVRTVSDGEGNWGFGAVAARGQYELTFSKAGFDVQSFIVTPVEGEIVSLDVVLEPGAGSLGGITVDANGPVGGVTIVASDGTLTYQTTTSTLTGQVGRWSISGVGTPAHYTVSASRRGYGTETLAVPLGAGSSRDDLTITLAAGVGSLTGRLTSLGDGVGGVTVSATDGTTVRSTTSLTEGDVGSYNLPQLPFAPVYTVTVEGDGWITQTFTVAVDGPETANIELVSAVGSISGTVTNDQGDFLDDAGITVTDGETTFKSTSAANGSFLLGGLPPGSYVVTFSRFEHVTVSEIVDVFPGTTRVLDVEMQYVPDQVPFADAELSGTVRDEDGVVAGVTVEVVNHDPPLSTTTNTNGSYVLRGIDFGTYVIRMTDAKHQEFTQIESFGLGTVKTLNATLFKFGSLRGEVTDAVSGQPVPTYTVSIAGPRTDFVSVSGVATGQFATGEDFPPGTYDITFDSVGYLPRTVQAEVPVGASDPVTVDIVLSRHPILRGTIFRPNSASSAEFVRLDQDIDLVLHGPPGAADRTITIPAGSTGDYVFDLGSELAEGSYTVDLSSSGFADVVGAPVVDLVANEDRRVNIVMSFDLSADPLVSPFMAQGSVSYRRDGALVPIVDQQVSITGTGVISGWLPSGGTDFAEITTDVNRTSDAAGHWIVPEQVWGQATYRFAHPDFVARDVDVDLFPDTGTALTPVELTPLDGSIAGAVTVRSVDPASDGTDVTLSAVGSADTATTVPDAAGAYGIASLTPGDYDLSAQLTDPLQRPRFVVTGSPSVVAVFPNAVATAAPIVVTELGRITATVSPADATVVLCSPALPSGGPGSCPGGNGLSTAAVGGTATFDRLPVSADPLNVPVTYDLTVSAPGHEAKTVTGLNVLAGSKLTPSVTLEAFGVRALTAISVRGIAVPTETPLDGATVTVDRILDAGGAPVAGPAGTVIDNGDGTYGITGPPGTYQISSITHPEHQTLVPVTPADQFVLANGDSAPIGEYRLAVRTGRIDVHVTDDQGTPLDLVGADVTITHTVETPPTGPFVTGAGGTVSIPGNGAGTLVAAGLQPGTWRVEATFANHHPVALDVVVAPAAASTATIRLLRKHATIDGTISGETPNGRSIGTVAGVAVGISGTFLPPASLTTTSATYSFAGLVNDTYSLTFSKSGYQTHPGSTVTVTNAADRYTRDVALVAQNGSITVDVDSTADVSGASVKVFLLTNGTPGASPVASAATDANGVATVSVEATKSASNTSPQFAYRVEITKPGVLAPHTSGPIDVQPAQAVDLGAITVGTLAGAPTALTATAGPGAGQVSLSWTAPASNGGSAITSYVVERRASGSGSYTGTSSGTTATTALVTGLTDGATYDFRVRAENAAGSGAPSNVDTETVFDVPDAPVLASPVSGDKSITITWTPQGTGGTPITSFIAQVKKDSQSWTQATSTTVTAPATTHTFTGLKNGDTYDLRVIAVNLVGQSTPSNVRSDTPAKVPDPPVLDSATSGNGQVVVDWTAPSDTGGGTLNSYIVQYQPAGGDFSSAQTVTVTGNPPATIRTITGLTNGTAYEFRVLAQTQHGTSDPSNVLGATPATTPGTPTGLGATPGDQQVALSWSAPASTGGSAITGYIVEHREGTTGSFTSTSTGSAATTFTVTGLTNGTAHQFRVTATNAVGNGSATATVTATPSTTPAAPVLAGTAGSGQVTLTWAAPANGGSAITGYVVEYVTPSGTGFGSPSTQTGVNPPGTTVTGLNHDATYDFRVRVTNANGTTSSNTVTLRTLAAVPTGVSATGASATSATVSWSPAAGAVQYRVQYRLTAAATFTDGPLVNAPTATATLTGLTAGSTYVVRVIALNTAAAPSAASTTASVTLVPAAPGAPTATTGGDTGEIDVTWTAVAGATSYTVEYREVGSTGPFATQLSTTTSTTLTGLTADTDYTVRVIATNAAGNSATSPTTTATSGA